MNCFCFCELDVDADQWDSWVLLAGDRRESDVPLTKGVRTLVRRRDPALANGASFL